ncbi:MAG: hypothetical protein K6U80_20490 [Firmicutes bacterium]|nr:hypothetical protein [Bacillota bacterium]
MNKIYLLLLSILFLIIEVGDLSASNQNAFGPPYDEIKDIEVEDLEPEECISYDEFVKEDYLDQQKYSGIWSTILHNKLDKLDIKIRSSSTLKGYPVTNLFDKKINTAWVPTQGIKGNGVGEWFLIDLYAERESETSTPFTVDLIGIIPGYLKNDKTWKENNRIKTALLIIKTPQISGPYYTVCRLHFKDFKGLETFRIPEYLIKAGDYDMISTIWVVIEDVYMGSKYTDTCISELVISGGCSN